MKFEIEVYSALCSLSKFVINGIDADEDYFVSKYDHSPETAEDYSCGDMSADILEPSDEAMEKYKITEEEFLQIAEEVAEKVSFGCCGMCS